MYEHNDDHETEDISLATALATQVNGTPWYVSSLAVHALLLLLLLLIPLSARQPVEPEVVIVPEVVVETIIPLEELDIEPAEEKVETPIEIDNAVDVPTPIIPETEIDISADFQTADEANTDTSLGKIENVTTIDQEVVGLPSVMGPGSSDPQGGGGTFGLRKGAGRRRCVAKYGGGPQTEKSVVSALRWLAAHQSPDGSWDCTKYGGGGHGGDDVAVTCLATLAFLGRGNTTEYGRYRRNVRKAVAWLIDNQNEQGYAGPHRYTAGLYMMVLAEAYGMSNEDAQLRRAAQRAVDWACTSQSPAGGWGYLPQDTRVDTSVAGWWIMGLKSAAVAGLHIETEVMDKARAYLVAATNAASGRVSYKTENAGRAEDVACGGGSPRMSAVAMSCLQFLGVKRNAPRVISSASYSARVMPSSGKMDFYNWYYQALGFFQLGPENKHWGDFNENMKVTLLSTQVRTGSVEQNKGSWNPDTDKYGPSWGRVGQTALGALMLEIYYRFREIEA